MGLLSVCGLLFIASWLATYLMSGQQFSFPAALIGGIIFILLDLLVM